MMKKRKAPKAPMKGAKTPAKSGDMTAPKPARTSMRKGMVGSRYCR